ncbi:MAG: transposase [Okeania sp. SIO3B3]|nr:transposase [Okeania sp. SIO3B3]
MTTKIVSSGGTVVLADQWFPSSKTCHNCGCINQELKLKDRTFECPHCGMRIDRDLNAALVLSQYGEINQNARGKAVPEFTLVNWTRAASQVEARSKHLRLALPGFTQ